MENKPPQTAKLPPNCGALVLIAVRLPRNLWFTPYKEAIKNTVEIQYISSSLIGPPVILANPDFK